MKLLRKSKWKITWKRYVGISVKRARAKGEEIMVASSRTMRL